MPRKVQYVKGSGRGSQLYVDIFDVVNGLNDFEYIAQKKIENQMQEIAEDLERYMKNNHPFENRTGDAEKNLTATVYSKDYGKSGKKQMIGVKLSHSAVHRGYGYGKALEYGTSHARPYPILEPTVRLKGPEEFLKLRGLLNRM